MNKEVKMMFNMADSIAKINGWEILRMDLQKCKMGSIVYHVLYMVYDNNGVTEEITIRNDCTICGHDE